MWNFTSRFSCFSLFGVPFKATRKSLCGFRKSRFSRFSLFGVPFKATRKSLCAFRCNITPDVPSGGSSSRGVARGLSQKPQLLAEALIAFSRGIGFQIYALPRQKLCRVLWKRLANETKSLCGIRLSMFIARWHVLFDLWPLF